MGKKKDVKKRGSLVEAITEMGREGEERKGLMSLPVMEDGDSADELTIQFDRGIEWVRSKLKGLAAQGKLEIGRKRSSDLQGRAIWVPSYKLKE